MTNWPSLSCKHRFIEKEPHLHVTCHFHHGQLEEVLLEESEEPGFFATFQEAESPALLEWLHSYAARSPLPCPYFPPTHSAFARAVLTQLALLPFGSTVTYGELAQRSGFPGAARAVGSVCARNPFALLLPCHRVVGAKGKLVGYSGGKGILTKQRLLDFESHI